MEYRNIFLANPARLSVQREQLVIEQAEKSRFRWRIFRLFSLSLRRSR